MQLTLLSEYGNKEETGADGRSAWEKDAHFEHYLFLEDFYLETLRTGLPSVFLQHLLDCIIKRAELLNCYLEMHDIDLSRTSLNFN